MRTEPAAPARVAFIINSLAGGGAERVFCRVVSGLEDRLADTACEVVLLDDETHAYSAPNFLPTRTLNANRSTALSVAKLSQELRRFRPDVAVSFLNRANCANLIASRWSGHRTVISERVATAEHFGGGTAGRFKRAVTRNLYRHADAIVAVSEGVRRGLSKDCGIPADRIDVIANPVDAARIRTLAALGSHISLPERFIVSVNRLAPNKNVQLQLDALQRSGLPHDLVILGDGPERASLVARAEALGLAGRVRFLGFIGNPYPIVARAEMFLSTSNAEGFPNALAEAMALGVPSISTNCRSGPAEILAEDPDLEISAMHAAQHGVLAPVNDAEACAAALRFLASPNHAAIYGQRAAERAQAYAPEAIIEYYWRVISRTGAPPAARRQTTRPPRPRAMAPHGEIR